MCFFFFLLESHPHLFFLLEQNKNKNKNRIRPSFGNNCLIDRLVRLNFIDLNSLIDFIDSIDFEFKE